MAITQNISVARDIEEHKARAKHRRQQSSLDDPARYSLESERQINELDPLHEYHDEDDEDDEDDDNHDSNTDTDDEHQTKLRPLRRSNGRSVHTTTGSGADNHANGNPLNRIRGRGKLKRLLLPGGSLCAVILVIVLLLVLLLGGGGVYVYQNDTIQGDSPPWSPTPKGGTVSAWEESYRKAAALVGRMTLPEKINITTGTGWQMGPCVGNTGPALEVGFPGLCLQDGPLGLRFADHITASPAGLTVGATWNKALMYKRGRMLGIEARAKGVNVLLGPSVGPLGRMPAGGRNWEGFGADPALQAIAGAETVKGIQVEHVMATVKHFIGNEQEHYRQANEWGLPNAISSNIDDRTLHELYLWPFAQAVKAGVASVMCSYNQVNNSYACQNSKLMNGILKDELGFQGFVQSDWLAQRSGVDSALSGLDMSMPGDGLLWADGESLWGPHLTMAALNGSVPIDRLNDMVTRIVAAYHQVGQDRRDVWPAPPPWGDGGPNFSSWTDEESGLLYPGSDDKTTGVVNQFVPAERKGGFSHRQLARRIAAEGIVLLKNQGQVLPLSRIGWPQQISKGFKKTVPLIKIAIVGEDARLDEAGPNACPDRACNQGTLASGWGSGAVEFPYLVSPVEALRGVFNNASVVLSEHLSNDLPSQSDASKIDRSDLCIVFANAAGGEGYIAWEDIKGDRNDLRLQNGGEELILDVAANCGQRGVRGRGKTVVVIHAVGPVLLEAFVENTGVDAVLLAHLPGQESGHALVDILLGDVNPSGRLPYTVGKSLDDYGPGAKILVETDEDTPQQDFTEGLLTDYRWFDTKEIEPRFPFGFGLSYTQFDLRDMIIGMPAERPAKLPGPRGREEVKPPSYSSSKPSPQEALIPEGFHKIDKYIYPYLENLDRVNSTRYVYPEPLSKQASEAGGGEGGNPRLWDVLIKVTITVVNNGERDGQAVVQLYVRFPEEVWEEYDDDEKRIPNSRVDRRLTQEDSSTTKDRPLRGRERIYSPLRVLRGFEKVNTYVKPTQEPNRPFEGMSQKVEFELTRRDLSYWSVRKQNWVFPDGQFIIDLGFSSRDIRRSGLVFG